MKYLNTIKKFLFASILGVGLLSTSCEHKNLYLMDQDPCAVRLGFDWKNLRAGDAIPEGMHIIFNGDEGIGSNVNTADGWNTAIIPGEYNFQGYSNDNPEIESTRKGEDIEISIVEPSDDVPAIYAFNKKEKIENGNTIVNGERVHYIEAVPYPVNCIYTIRIQSTDAIPNATAWYGILDGLTDAIRLSTGKSAPMANEISRSFTLTKSPAENEQFGKISVLGKMSGSQNILHIRVKKSNGSYEFFKCNVTSQIENAADFRNVEIIVDMVKDCTEDTKPNDDHERDLNTDVDIFDEIEEEIIL